MSLRAATGRLEGAALHLRGLLANLLTLRDSFLSDRNLTEEMLSE
jgi:hypothetical protein